MLPVADTSPTVSKLPPVTLPEAIMAVVTLTLPPSTLPVAETVPLVRKLPPCTLAVTFKLLSVPTELSVDVVTLELNVVPVIKEAAGAETTPVS